MRTIKCFSELGAEPVLPVYAVAKAELDAWLAARPRPLAAFVTAAGFHAEPGRILPLPAEAGLSGYLVGRPAPATDNGLWAGALASGLPETCAVQLDGMDGAALARSALGWALGAYQFTQYKEARRGPARLALPRGLPTPELTAAIEAAYLVRDLVNTPASDMGPAEIEAEARALAHRHGASIAVTTGDELLQAGFGLIHAVGRGSPRTPRLIDLTWGPDDAPKLTLVGKGIVFDTGGLDIKPASGMQLMKKDMGGAAHVLGLAHMVMSAKLPVRLRVLVPTAENSVSGTAFRPSDILRSYKGLTVEVGNTDAEGRLVLADALALADSDAPDLLIDMATLTGAARSALGPDVPALFTDDDALAGELMAAGEAEADPLWRLPLWQPYAKWLESPVADISNDAGRSFAGAIAAALFLKRFVDKAKAYAHLDIYAWNASASPHAAIGGEAQTLRAIFRVLKARFAP
jgi:leucyl aminopeptidase